MTKARPISWALTTHPVNSKHLCNKSHKSSIMPKASPVNGALTVRPVGVCAKGRSGAVVGKEKEKP